MAARFRNKFGKEPPGAHSGDRCQVNLGPTLNSAVDQSGRTLHNPGRHKSVRPRDLPAPNVRSRQCSLRQRRNKGIKSFEIDIPRHWTDACRGWDCSRPHRVHSVQSSQAVDARLTASAAQGTGLSVPVRVAEKEATSIWAKPASPPCRCRRCDLLHSAASAHDTPVLLTVCHEWRVHASLTDCGSASAACCVRCMHHRDVQRDDMAACRPHD